MSAFPSACLSLVRLSAISINGFHWARMPSGDITSLCLSLKALCGGCFVTVHSYFFTLNCWPCSLNLLSVFRYPCRTSAHSRSRRGAIPPNVTSNRKKTNGTESYYRSVDGWSGHKWALHTALCISNMLCLAAWRLVGQTSGCICWLGATACWPACEGEDWQTGVMSPLFSISHLSFTQRQWRGLSLQLRV